MSHNYERVIQSAYARCATGDCSNVGGVLSYRGNALVERRPNAAGPVGGGGGIVARGIAGLATACSEAKNQPTIGMELSWFHAVGVLEPDVVG